MRVSVVPALHQPASDDEVLKLFRLGWDTFEIARAYSLEEHVVCRMLDWARTRDHAG